MKWALFFIFFSNHSYSSIFGNDDRIDTRFASASVQELARSVPALIQKHRIHQVGENKFYFSGIPMSDLQMCKDENFSNESLIANCSASLIAPDKVLTAAHCLDSVGYECSTYNVVFDYQNDGSNEYVLDGSQIYQCNKILYFDFKHDLSGVDLAVIELDRPVLDRTPVKVKHGVSKGEELFMIGYPLGISQKVVESGRVLSVDKKNVSFKTDLDAFSVNSGGPIFNSQNEQVGVLVRGTGLNLDKYDNESCYRWHRATSPSEFSAGNDLSPIPTILLDDK